MTKRKGKHESEYEKIDDGSVDNPFSHDTLTVLFRSMAQLHDECDERFRSLEREVETLKAAKAKP